MSPLKAAQLRRLCLRKIISVSDYLMYKRLRRLRNDEPKIRRRFSLNKFGDIECLRLYRFDREELFKMRRLLLPMNCKSQKGDKFTGLEGLCILLRRFCYPNRLSDICGLFGRTMASVSRIFNWTLNYIYSKFGNLVTSMENKWINSQSLQQFSEVISEAGSPYPNLVGFIDGTARAICRPKRNQREQYSGYKKQHVLKYQSVVFPNGLIGKLDGPFNGRRHDSAILRLSGLLDVLKKKLVMADGSWYCLYGDPGYSNQKFIKVGYKNHQRLNPLQKEFNANMSALRVHVEYGFGKILQNFAFVDFKKNQKLLLQPLKKYYMCHADQLPYLYKRKSNC